MPANWALNPLDPRRKTARGPRCGAEVIPQTLVTTLVAEQAHEIDEVVGELLIVAIVRPAAQYDRGGPVRSRCSTDTEIDPTGV